MRKLKRNFTNFALFAFGNAVVMVIVSFLLIQSMFVNSEDRWIIGLATKVKDVLFGLEHKPRQDDFLFINVAYDIQLHDKLDANGFNIGQEAITDRWKLALFLKVLNDHPSQTRAVLCDVFFADSSGRKLGKSADEFLAQQFTKLPVVVAGQLKGDVLDPGIFPAVSSGFAEFQTGDGTFFKFELFHDTIKSLPVKMFEVVNGTQVTRNRLFVNAGPYKFFNRVIPPMYIRPYDLFDADVKDRYAVETLTSLMSGVLNEDDILQRVKNRIIIIGDLERADMHETIYGDLPGALILLNTYLMILRGDNSFTWLFVPFLLLAYWLITLVLLYNENFLRRLRRLLAKQVADVVPDLLNAGLMLMIVSLISYVFFEFRVSILYLTLYLIGFKRLVNWLFEPRQIFD